MVPTWMQTAALGFSTPTIQTIAIGPVLPPKIQHLNLIPWTLIEYLSSDRIMTWSICRLSRLRCTSTFHSQICHLATIGWVVIENWRIPPKFWCFFTVTQQIFVWLQIRGQEIQELLKLHNLHIHHVTTRWALKYLIAAKVGVTV